MNHEKECYDSPDGKHKRGMIKSGLHPEYACIYCFMPMRTLCKCPKCGYRF